MSIRLLWFALTIDENVCYPKHKFPSNQKRKTNSRMVTIERFIFIGKMWSKDLRIYHLLDLWFCMKKKWIY